MTGIFQTTDLFQNDKGGKTALTCTLQGDSLLTVERDIPRNTGGEAAVLRETFNFESGHYRRQLLDACGATISSQDSNFAETSRKKLRKATELKVFTTEKRALMTKLP